MGIAHGVEMPLAVPFSPADREIGVTGGVPAAVGTDEPEGIAVAATGVRQIPNAPLPGGPAVAIASA